MKAVLQVGPAQFVVEGATFHLLCSDIHQTLHSIVPLTESEISLTLHTDGLERCLADDAQRLAEAGIKPPRDLHEDSSDAVERVTVAVPRRLSVDRVGTSLNIFSSDSFDVAEAMVQELQTRVMEQRRRLALHAAAMRPTQNGELRERGDGGDARVPSEGSAGGAGVPHRVVPLPLLRLDTYLSTSADVQPEYNVEGQRRCSSQTVMGS